VSTIPAAADARVQESSPGTNYASVFLRADGGADPDVESYLRFNVTGLSGTVRSAKLRVFVTNPTGGGPSVSTTSTGWSETGLTWSTRPARSGLRDRKGKIAVNTWVEFDVTPFVTGNAPVAFVIANDTSDAIDFNSREASANRPELVITTG
jgi:hypothetical protein